MIFQTSKKTPKKGKVGKNVYSQILNQQDEFKLKNMMRETPKLLFEKQQSIAIRNDFLKSQKIVNYQNEITRLTNIEKSVIPNLRFPPSRGGSYGDSGDRIEQLQRQINENIDLDYIDRPFKQLFNRYY